MPLVHRLGDNCSGHGCYSPRPLITASPDYFVDGIAVGRVTDEYESHGCEVCTPHGGQVAEGSPNFFVNGLAIARQGDPVTCGSTCDIHSPDFDVN